MLSVLQHLRPSRSRWLLPALVFVVFSSSVLLFARWQEDRQNIENDAAANIESAASAALLRERFKLHAQFLRSLSAFAATNLNQIESFENWQHFVQEINIASDLPGLYAFVYAPVIDKSEAEAFRKKVQRKLAYENFHFFPQIEAELVAPIIFIKPDGPLQRPAIGFNLLSEKTRIEAVETSLRNQDVALSGPIILVTGERTKRPGFLLVNAIFHPGRPNTTIDERRAALAGLVVTGYHADDFVDALKSSFSARFALQVFDDGGINRSVERPPELIFDSAPDFKPTPDTRVIHRELDFGGRTWILKFREFEHAGNNAAFDQSKLIIALGLAGSLLISLLIFYLTTHRERAERYARRLTAALTLSEERFRLAAEGTSDALWDQNIINGDDHISSRLGEILGFPKATAPRCSKDFLALIHPDDEPKRCVALRRHFREGTHYDVTLRVRNHARKWVWLRIRGQAVRQDEARVSRMAGSISDVTELHNAQIELTEHRDHLQGLVNQRTARLDQALLEAQAATLAKTEFLANMSHELRTPMHAILSFSELGQRLTIDQEASKPHQYFNRIAQSADRLLLLIDDLLDLSKLESGHMVLQYSQTDIALLIARVHGQLESLIQRRNLSLQTELVAGDHFIAIDQARIEQVFHNLLSNAIKFSPENGVITISSAPADLPKGRRSEDSGKAQAISICISDLGPGIPEEELESIFGKFVQSSLTKTGAGGTGLGLAICKEIIERHRGTILAANNSGGGTSFTVTLPLENRQEGR